MAGEIFSIPEAAAILGVSRIAVFKRVKNGSIPAFRVGRSWAIARTDLPGTSGRPAGDAAPRRHAAARPPAERSQPPSSPPSPATPTENSEELDSMGWD